MSEKKKVSEEVLSSEFKQTLSSYEKQLNERSDIRSMGRLIQDFVKQVTPAKEVQLLLLDKSMKEMKTVTLDKNMMMNISNTSGMMAEVLHTRKALFTNDVERELKYKEDVDNFLHYPLKSLLLFPLVEDENIWGLIWAGIPRKDLHQYMKIDLAYLEQMQHLLKKPRHETDEEIKPLESDVTAESKLKNTSLITKIKSWFS